mgnify:CR=1 FL=1
MKIIGRRGPESKDKEDKEKQFRELSMKTKTKKDSKFTLKIIIFIEKYILE